MKFPIGIQDFGELREGGYVYVDKTRHIHNIITRGKYYFLSRPRRFGKSLLISTLNELYRGRRELFKGLWIENNWDWEAMQRPVLWLRMASRGIRTLGLEAGLKRMLAEQAEGYGMQLSDTTYDQQFRELIEGLRVKTGQRAVILIDEYDKPIIDYLDDEEKAERHREILKSFYSVLKDSDAGIELLFITGVSAFSQVSIFSDLNNLNNITLHRWAHTLTGITEAEIDHYFTPVLQEADRQRMRAWYNGYSWGSDERVYNPMSLLSFLQRGQYQNFWFETGTPTFLVKEMRRHNYFDVDGVKVRDLELLSFDVHRLNPIGILFQTGYLTVAKVVPNRPLYTLTYPNLEVKTSLLEALLKEYAPTPSDQLNIASRIDRMVEALETGDIEALIQALQATYASIPYDHWSQNQTEHFYHAIFHLTFELIGTLITSEVHSSRGRADVIVKTEEYIYAFEFKLDQSTEEALTQIQKNGYLQPYTDSPQRKLAIGVNFSSEARNINGYIVEES